MFRISRAGREVVDCREVSTNIKCTCLCTDSVALLCFLHGNLPELLLVQIICVSV